MSLSRRDIMLASGTAALATAAGPVSRAAAQGHAGHDMGAMAAPMPQPTTPRRPAKSAARDGRYTPVRTLNGWTLPFRLNNGVKEFHLVAEEFQHEFAPGSTATCWGYNGSTPGPTIEAVEGDRIRIFVTNRLGEHKIGRAHV